MAPILYPYDGDLLSVTLPIVTAHAPLPLPPDLLRQRKRFLGDVAAALESAQVSWTDLKWIRELWDGPIVMKGVVTVDDAKRSARRIIEAARDQEIEDRDVFWLQQAAL